MIDVTPRNGGMSCFELYGYTLFATGDNVFNLYRGNPNKVSDVPVRLVAAVVDTESAVWQIAADTKEWLDSVEHAQMFNWYYL